MLTHSVRGKSSSGFKKSHRIDLPKAKKGWVVRIRRLSPNRHSDLISDTVSIDAITHIIDAKLRYPATAMLGLCYDAKTFNNIAKLAVRLKGKLIRVPTNYNSDTRQYHGLWDGTLLVQWGGMGILLLFVSAWTNMNTKIENATLKNDQNAIAISELVKDSDEHTAKIADLHERVTHNRETILGVKDDK